MIKKLTCVFILTNLLIIKLFAQDSTAYELQRAKINALLAERSAKFGQYDASLNTRTGIFGFQTKKDIRNSNEILRAIAINDNKIFTELKVLMDYKDLQVEQVKTAVTSNSTSIQNYKKTIKNLQDKNQELLIALEKAEKNKNFAYLLTFLFLVGLLVLGYILYINKKKLKFYEKGSI